MRPSAVVRCRESTYTAAMCGRFQIEKNKQSKKLLNRLDVPEAEILFSSDKAPGSRISIIRREKDRNVVTQALWWLLIDPVTGKPNYKYASFNSRSDKLDSPRAIAYQPYRESRCIIPATAFLEGKGDKKTYHRIALENEAIAFGGLHRETIDKQSGEVIHSASIITLPPLPEWEAIHPKSMPLMLPMDDERLINRWLAPSFHDVEVFRPLLAPAIRTTQVLTPIEKPSKWSENGPSFTIAAH
jgi:putative SOS response-associated peptidase YedK